MKLWRGLACIPFGFYLALSSVARTLNAPGKFLISAAERDTPKRARAYLLTDQAVEAAATYYAGYRLPFNAVSQRAAEETGDSPRTGGWFHQIPTS